ncbi:MAG: hypothetical protein ACI93P_001551 [bacterium]|jgi:hypothetical protein
MKIGIIIIFNNNENDIDKDLFSKQIKKTQNIKFCLVNNCSKDKTYQILKEIKEECDSIVSIVNVKKIGSETSAKRAGARYMINQFELKHLGYINTKPVDLANDSFYNLIKNISDYQKEILEYNIENLKKKEIRKMKYQSLFSVIENIKKIQSKINFQT